MSLKLKCYLKLICRQNCKGIKSEIMKTENWKGNGTITELSPKLKYHMNFNVTNSEMSLKLKCH